MMEFPRYVFTFSRSLQSMLVQNQEEHTAALKAGWLSEPQEAIDAAKAPQAATPEPEIPADDAPPTREELETQAAKLGIKFDGRMKDATLARKIDEAMAEQGV